MYEAGADLETGVVVPVPEAAPLVASHRLRLDPSAAQGMPEHITLLYPFVPADDAVIQALRGVFRDVRAFDFVLTGPAWFSQAILYLAPEPPAPFRALTRALVERFGVPPYRGAFEEIVPHLTVAMEEGEAGLAAELAHGLPIAARATEALLLVRSGGGWVTAARYPFG
jgi:2'-5' RNA ligase